MFLLSVCTIYWNCFRIGVVLVLVYDGLYSHFWKLSSSLSCVSARTIDDNIREMGTGNGKVLLGAYLCEVAIIKMGIREGGTLDAILTPFLGSVVLNIGKPYINFPSTPPLHLAINNGNKKAVEAAFYMMLHGADINQYQVSNQTANFSNYPPAITLAIGLGKPPRNSHAALLDMLYQLLPDKFNFTKIEMWRLTTNNPPLTHIAALANFFDGVYVLTTAFKMDINVVDNYNLTVAHIASWKGNSFMLKYLLYSACNILSVDIFGRSILHYAALRGDNAVITDILYAPLKDSFIDSQLISRRCKLLMMVDSRGFMAIDLASNFPPIQLTVEYLYSEMNKCHKINDIISNYSTRNRKQAINVAENRSLLESLPDPDLGDDIHRSRGGWDYSSVLSQTVHTTTTTTTTPRLPLSCDIMKYNPSIISITNIEFITNTSDETVIKIEECLSIDVISATNITKDLFQSEYYHNHRPVMITDNLSKRQGIWSSRQKSEFLKHYGDILVSFGENLFSIPNSKLSIVVTELKQMKLSEFVDTYMSVSRSCGVNDINSYNVSGYEISSITRATSSSTKSTELFVAMNDTASSTKEFYSLFHNDFEKSNIFKLCGYEDRNGLVDFSVDEEPFKIYVGPKGSGAPIHSHSASWNLLISGVKRWYLVPPGYRNEVSRSILNNKNTNNHKQDDYNNNNNLSDINIGSELNPFSVQKWLNTQAESLRKQGVLYEVIQYPGDVIFIPHDWFHATLYETDSISISQEFCRLRNTNMRYQPLGYAIYSGFDHFKDLGYPNTLI